MTTVLDVRDLRVGFRQDGSVTHAVRGVSFQVQKGETVALVGESGSGKSVTALSSVQLLDDSAVMAGSIKYNGEEMVGADERTLRRVRGNDISFIFQEPMTSLNPLHTIEKQLRESIELHQGHLLRRVGQKRSTAIARRHNWTPAKMAFVAGSMSIFPPTILLVLKAMSVLGSFLFAWLCCFVLFTAFGYWWGGKLKQRNEETIVDHDAIKLTDPVGAHVIDLLRRVGIHEPEKRLGSYPHQLSGGQRQRVMIAMALANRPELLIADEPTTALDVTIQAQILELLAELKRDEGMSMLFITHDLTIVRKIADRVCVMKNGEIVETGLTNEIFANPQHPYTQMLLAAESTGLPVPVAPDAPVVLRTDKSRIWFPIHAGLLKRTVGHVKAVNEASLEIRAGETLGVVGESGSGKTTLALAVMRLISSEGKIAYLGQQIETLSAKQMRPLRSEMQIVFQDPYGSLSPRMTVAEIIAEGLGVHGVEPGRNRREMVREIMQEVGLDPDTMDRYPHEFSGGQRQRIAIARAMILRPKFVVLDEPTSALDMTVQVQIVQLLRDLQQKYGLAYLFISHDLKVVRALSHKVMVMKQGDVVEAGDADAIFDAPQTDYTRALMAAAFEGKVV
ncbi:ABC transporter ATP-binding protein [Loktanella sp. S4079]|uniref:ABC transporter ATP-binding protein n=1 Tax=Loktanella sp. S4079 TaxID=579483 RepID=UPI000A015635|nr:ABC transporter ATP-binding protein [Loktanella sp. S4079]